MRTTFKTVARALATLAVSPVLASFFVKQAVIGRNRALEGSSQLLAAVPGIPGQYLRAAFLHWAIDECAPDVTVEYGTIFSQAGARLGRNCYIGPHGHIGLAHIGADVLLAAGVHVPSGGKRHGTEDVTRSIREQPGQVSVVRIGTGSWVGSATVVLADVGCHAVVGAGSVVSKPIPDYAVAVGTPARVLRDRRDAAPSPDPPAA